MGRWYAHKGFTPSTMIALFCVAAAVAGGGDGGCGSSGGGGSSGSRGGGSTLKAAVRDMHVAIEEADQTLPMGKIDEAQYGETKV